MKHWLFLLIIIPVLSAACHELLYVTDSRNGLYVLRYTGPGAEVLAIPWAEGNVTTVP